MLENQKTVDKCKKTGIKTCPKCGHTKTKDDCIESIEDGYLIQNGSCEKCDYIFYFVYKLVAIASSKDTLAGIESLEDFLEK